MHVDLKMKHGYRNYGMEDNFTIYMQVILTHKTIPLYCLLPVNLNILVLSVFCIYHFKTILVLTDPS